MIRYDLDGKWSLFGENGQRYEAMVPGDVFKDLIDVDVIEDPYYSDNSHKCTWVCEKDWKYVKEFEVDELDKVTYLVFEGIDTVTEIFLNGEKIAETDNMFMKYRFDVSDKLKIGTNVLAVVIKSIRNELSKYPEEGYFGCFNVQRIFIRKAQCHFSWDWAPDFPSAGIWKDVYIESINDTYINDYKIKTENDGKVTFFVNLPEECEYGKEREIEITVDNEIYRYKTKFQKNFYTFKIENPRLWWPRTLGEPNLYDFNIKLFSDGVLCDEKSGRFGIRTVRLEEKPKVNLDGFTCQLYVNDVPVFLKGANWVPLDVMTGTITKERYEKAIHMAYDANFSMLRVWGGGIYENDIFYEICDRLGIMVWQDFAYACADVPDNIPSFVEKAIKEAEYQVCRLRNYPSLVLYCGGNEKTGSHGLNKKYGDKIIYYYIRGVVDHLDGTRPYFPSSPWGYGDIGNTQSSGDSHCNSYQTAMISPENQNAVGLENFRDALKLFDAALVSEIAIQGAPPVESLKKYIPEDKLWPLNEIYDIHFMRNPYDGTGKTFPTIQYEAAEKLFGKIDDLYDFCKKSSVLHSELLRADCEYHKARIGTCSGTMTWMFNDIWPCGTWSAIDYYLQPSPAYYSLKRSYANENLIITKTRKGYEIFVVNELNKETEYEVEYGIMDLNGKVKFSQKCGGKILKYSSKSLYCFENTAENDEFMYVRGKIGNSYKETTLFDTLWKDISWIEPHMQYQTEKTDNGVKLIFNTENYARTVNISVKGREDVSFSDNYFDILPQSSREVYITGENISEQDILVKTWLDEWN